MTHPLLFSPNPPNDAKYVKTLFCGRDNQVKHSIDRLKARYNYGKICAVFGQTQVGKSHFSMYLLHEIDADLSDRYFSIQVNANNERSCLGVLAGIYRALTRRFREAANKTYRHDEKKARLINLCEERIMQFASWDRYGNLSLMEVQITSEQEKRFSTIDKQYASGSLSAKIWGLVSAEARLGLEKSKTGTDQQKSVSSEKLQFNRPNEETYLILILFLSGILTLILSENDDTVPILLLYVDDLDLIEQPLGNERTIVDEMIDYLGRLAQEQYITVMASVRDYFYYYREKDFDYFQELMPIEPDELMEIYDSQIRELNDGVDLFEPGAIQELAAGSDNIPGRFKRLLNEVHQNLYGKPLYTRTETLTVFKKLFERTSPEIKSIVENTISAGSLQLPKEVLDDLGISYMEPILRSKHILYPHPGGGYEISRILHNALIDKE